ncbi:GNAT family N-acetyltransferase [Solicola sp. PLA-1-18]|uniref:GNAT family N-acetyltransferase n=1 Tax=Solicola sp. PLA-1-18 TaxID=3380532 RepID=UPI003B774CD7
MQIRPMRTSDVDAAEQVSAAAMLQVGERTRRAVDPPATRRAEWWQGQWRRRAEHLVEHDGPGCWVAEDDDGLAGLAVSMRRDTLWGLASFFVRPGTQGGGVGKALLDAALTHSVGCTRGMICATSDAGALRRYHQAGFRLHPTMTAEGPVDRSLLPVVEHVREGSQADLDLMESVDRQTRAATHGPDHAFMGAAQPLLVSDSHLGSGYAYLSPSGAYLLAATSERTATALLWESIARTPGDTFAVRHVTGEQDWLVDVAMAARLTLRHEGFLALQWMRPPRTYVPSPHFM